MNLGSGNKFIKFIRSIFCFLEEKSSKYRSMFTSGAIGHQNLFSLFVCPLIPCFGPVLVINILVRVFVLFAGVVRIPSYYAPSSVLTIIISPFHNHTFFFTIFLPYSIRLQKDVVRCQMFLFVTTTAPVGYYAYLLVDNKNFKI